MRIAISSKHPIGRLTAAVFVLLVTPEVIATGMEQDGAKRPEEIVFVLPSRRAPDAVPKGPAAVPPAGEQVAPLTLDVVTRYVPLRGAQRSIRHSVSRTHDRIHLALAGKREWLLIRNPVDPRRVSGMLIDHAARTIVVHEESDLRTRLGVNGWADALLLGLDAEMVPRLRAAAESRAITGVRFNKQVVAGGPGELSDVWWNAEFALPGAYTVKSPGGSTRISVERIVRGVNGERLQLPSSRFPSYKVVDLADWLEIG
jgi:hypothetical protein